jgi:hypothetical protein
MEPLKMKFTGTLIEDLMATVERVERRPQSDEASVCEPTLIAPMLTESAEPFSVAPWLTSLPQNADYESKFIGVA